MIYDVYLSDEYMERVGNLHDAILQLLSVADDVQFEPSCKKPGDVIASISRDDEYIFVAARISTLDIPTLLRNERPKEDYEVMCSVVPIQSLPLQAWLLGRAAHQACCGEHNRRPPEERFSPNKTAEWYKRPKVSCLMRPSCSGATCARAHPHSTTGAKNLSSYRDREPGRRRCSRRRPIRPSHPAIAPYLLSSRRNLER